MGLNFAVAQVSGNANDFAAAIMCFATDPSVILTLASRLHVSEEARILLIVTVEVCVRHLREDRIIRSRAS